MEKIKARSDVDKNLTWDLTHLFESDVAANNECESIVKKSKELKKKYQGKLNNIEIIKTALYELEELAIRSSYVSSYFSLKSEVDLTNAKVSSMKSKAYENLNELYSNIKALEVEISENEMSVLKELEKIDDFRALIRTMIIEKPHTLSRESEDVLSKLQGIFDIPMEGYSAIKFQDMEFEDFEVDGKVYNNSFSLFEETYEYHKNREVRRKAFESFNKTLRKYNNSTAKMFEANMKKEKAISKIRGYESATDYLLDKQQVERQMYENQLDIIMEKLSPVMRRFARIIKKELGIEKLNYYDLKANIDPEYDPEVTLEKGKEYIYEATSVLGEDYVNIMKEILDNRCVDYVQNIGKATGAFCDGPYKKLPYILMVWTGKMDSVFTLIHELGHGGNDVLSSNNVSYYNVMASLYYIESPSTMHEMLLANHLMKDNDDSRFKRWVYFSIVAKTYYHNYVTHFLEAYFQREAYKIIDEGGSLDAQTLNDLYLETLKKFWGDEIEYTEGCEMTWMRQPHYYVGLYSYTYSAGLNISTDVSRKILEGDKDAIENWKEAISLGGLLTPKQWAEKCGIDIEKTDSFVRTIEYIEHMVDEIEKLSKDI